MSYSRWASDCSVYVFMHVEEDTRGPFLTCCGCSLRDEGCFDTWTTQGMVDHLNEHIAAGHKVPAHLISDLIADDAENFPAGKGEQQ